MRAAADRTRRPILQSVRQRLRRICQPIPLPVGKLLLERRDADRSAELAGAARKLRKALLPYFPGIPETVTNFVYIETPQASEIAAYLASRGIAVRLFPNALRITAGSSAENDALLAALRDYFAK